MMRTKLIGVVLLFLGIALLAGSLPTIFSPTFQKCEAQYNQDENGTTKEKDPPRFGVMGYVDCMGSFIEANNGGITALATLIIATFTFTLWRATSAQGKLTREALVADKRAFVFPVAIYPYWDFDKRSKKYSWRFRPMWRNTGDTPTKHMRLHTVCEIRNTALPNDFNFDYFTDNIGRGTLGPKYENQGGLAPAMPSPAISPSDLIEVQKGGKFLYLIGWVKYFDAFPGTPEHITRFCWQIFPDGNPMTYDPGSADPKKRLTFGYVHVPRGNCTDEECSLN